LGRVSGRGDRRLEQVDRARPDEGRWRRAAEELPSDERESHHAGGAGTGQLPGDAKPFSQASHANGSVRVDHLPGGVKRVTHVFWTPCGE
jgi:hypothetical protein